MDPWSSDELLTHHLDRHHGDEECLQGDFPSGRVPGSASEPSRTRVDDGGGLGDFRGIVLGYLGYTRVEE